MSTTEPQFNDPPRPFHQYPLRIVYTDRVRGAYCLRPRGAVSLGAVGARTACVWSRGRRRTTGARRPTGITDAWHGSLWQRLGISDCQILSLDRSFCSRVCVLTSRQASATSDLLSSFRQTGPQNCASAAQQAHPAASGDAPHSPARRCRVSHRISELRITLCPSHSSKLHLQRHCGSRAPLCS